MFVKDHNKFRRFDYDNAMNNPNFRLGQVVINQENEIGVVIQLHEDGDCRTDMFGNCSSSEVTTATLDQIKKFRQSLLSDLDLDNRAKPVLVIWSNGNVAKDVQKLADTRLNLDYHIMCFPTEGEYRVEILNDITADEGSIKEQYI